MVTITIEDDTLIVNVQGLDQFWAFKRKLFIPLDRLQRVYSDPDVRLGWWKGIRFPGTLVPGVIVAGTYYHKGKRIFWDVKKRGNAIVLDLNDNYFDQLIVEVEDPAKIVEQIQTAIN